MDDAKFFDQAISQYDDKLKAINQKVAVFFPYTIAPLLTRLDPRKSRAWIQ